NDTMAHYSVARLPFGGTKLSGNTRTHGRGEVTQFTHQKAYSISRPPNPIDPVIWIRRPGAYRLLKAMMGATYGTTLQQRVGPMGELVAGDERARHVASKTAAGVGAFSALAALAVMVFRVRRH